VVTPESDALQIAHKSLAVLEEIPLYARIDMVRYNGEFHIMELELTEPHLFLPDKPGSAAMFAEKIRQKLC
jgi:hypothetical protein